ncbi:hypothetical protein SAMD00019534_115880 [Acytostelium subglobosum LB1]|uniref:hypothetical protein n=1 Tax=Acytostelium subglobosum LB1 TaxID=1410327 RepID=UPI0006448C8A|nr:hypothetical protein SAMD00019534_115880 [Acytostelium subglobosum LB1]GAM28412.1 hypothetical protein SAMD00019534_115880 [Acytostelium subglobosum LB1]|eukprot:XP_012748729.1 hypothetical protein SAMD00019534_115880 [Acytostelium subglobosum LB1]
MDFDISRSLASVMYQCAAYKPQSGCIPLRIKKKKLAQQVALSNGEMAKLFTIDFQVMLVTSGGGDSWVFPKGSIKKSETKKEAAKRETFEEAGLEGKFAKSIPPLEVADHHKECNLTYYVLYVKKVNKQFDEADKRKRHWFSLATVLQEAIPMKPHIQQAIISTQRALNIHSSSFGNVIKIEYKTKKKEVEAALLSKL